MSSINYIRILKEAAKNVINNQNLLTQGYIEKEYNIIDDLKIIASIRLNNGDFDNNVFLTIDDKPNKIKIFNYLWPRISEIGKYIIESKKDKFVDKLYYNWNILILAAWVDDIQDCKELADKLYNCINRNLDIC